MKKTIAVLALALGMSFGTSTVVSAQSWNSNAPHVQSQRNFQQHQQRQVQRQVHRQLQNQYRREMHRQYRREAQRQYRRELRRQYYGDRGYRDGYGRSGYYRSGPGYYYN